MCQYKKLFSHFYSKFPTASQRSNGVPRTTIRDDIKNIRNDETVKANIPDHRVKVDK